MHVFSHAGVKTSSFTIGPKCNFYDLYRIQFPGAFFWSSSVAVTLSVLIRAPPVRSRAGPGLCWRNWTAHQTSNLGVLGCECGVQKACPSLTQTIRNLTPFILLFSASPPFFCSASPRQSTLFFCSISSAGRTPVL